ncbi:hypothetical protein ABK040_008790 [Willaertia magna]
MNYLFNLFLQNIKNKDTFFNFINNNNNEEIFINNNSYNEFNEFNINEEFNLIKNNAINLYNIFKLTHPFNFQIMPFYFRNIDIKNSLLNLFNEAIDLSYFFIKEINNENNKIMLIKNILYNFNYFYNTILVLNKIYFITVLDGYSEYILIKYFKDGEYIYYENCFYFIYLKHVIINIILNKFK